MGWTQGYGKFCQVGVSAPPPKRSPVVLNLVICGWYGLFCLAIMALFTVIKTLTAALFTATNCD